MHGEYDYEPDESNNEPNSGNESHSEDYFINLYSHNTNHDFFISNSDLEAEPDERDWADGNERATF